MKLVRTIASLRLTLTAILAAAGLLLAGIMLDRSMGLPLAVTFSLMTVNLVCAIACHRRLRTGGPLLVFHIGLATIALLAAIGRLTYLSGHVEVAEGAMFDPALVVDERGWLHPSALDAVRFVQGDFRVDYAPGVNRRDTVSTVFAETRPGQVEQLTVGDDDALVLQGYRFYTSFNKGLAPHLAYLDRSGRLHQGAVHMPSYPLHDYRQGQNWPLPDGAGEIKLWLSLEEPPLIQDASWSLERPQDLPATLVVIDANGRHELGLNDSLEAGYGTITFLGLGGWMGYTIDYDPTRIPVLGVAILTAFAFATYAARRVCRPLPGRRAA